jgi:hypothetical protein
MASRTGLSAKPSVSLPKLTSGAGNTAMISSPTAATGDPSDAVRPLTSPAMPSPANPATTPASPAHRRVTAASDLMSRWCTVLSSVAQAKLCPLPRLRNRYGLSGAG